MSDTSPELEHMREVWGRDTCEFCGEQLRMNDDVGEWYYPDAEEHEIDMGLAGHKIGHEICARQQGWELA